MKQLHNPAVNRRCGIKLHSAGYFYVMHPLSDRSLLSMQSILGSVFVGKSAIQLILSQRLLEIVIAKTVKDHQAVHSFQR
jgi:hypothetical protein